MSGTPTSPPLTRRLAAALQCWAGAGIVQLDARSFDGIGGPERLVTPIAPHQVVPYGLLRWLLDDWSVRVAAATFDGPAPVALPLVVALWRPETTFEDRRHLVTLEAQAALTATLARLPQPSIVVDAGPEVWAGWRLEAPLDVARAPEILARVAQLAGADDDSVRDLAVLTLPLCGVIRNWNGADREYAAIVDVDAARTYALDHLLAALENPDDARDPSDHPEPGSGPRRLAGKPTRRRG